MGYYDHHRRTQIADIKDKIYELKDQCGELYRECRDTGHFDAVKHDQLSKDIEWLEYLLWGARVGHKIDTFAMPRTK